MRVLVCGGRSYSDTQKVFSVLDRIHGDTPISVIIEGGATGADARAGEWAASRGVAQSVFVADWKSHGKAAGPIRNQRMLDEGKPDLVVAFPGGSGTANMTMIAGRAGVPVMVIET